MTFVPVLVVLIFIIPMMLLVMKVSDQRMAIEHLLRMKSIAEYEIGFLTWNDNRHERSAREYHDLYYELTGNLAKRMHYCIARQHGDKIKVTVGYRIGYRYEVDNIGFTVDTLERRVINDMTGEHFNMDRDHKDMFL